MVEVLSSAHRAPDCRTVADVQLEVMDRSERYRITRFLRSWNDKDAISGWRLDLDRVLQVFNVCSACLRLVATDSPLFRLNLFRTKL